jgi:hypothetical protein
VERLRLAGLHPGNLAVGGDHLHGRLHAARDRHGIVLFPKINDDLLNLVAGNDFAEIVGVADNAAAGGVADDEGVGLVCVAMQLERRAVEQACRHELPIFQTFKTLTGRLFLILLHVIRIGNRCEPLRRLYGDIKRFDCASAALIRRCDATRAFSQLAA